MKVFGLILYVLGNEKLYGSNSHEYIYVRITTKMNLSLQEVDHILSALDSYSSYKQAQAREQIIPGVSNQEELVQKLKDYRVRLT